MPLICKSEGYVQFTLNTGVIWGGWLPPRPGRFTLAKDPEPIAQEAGWAQHWSGRLQKFLSMPKFERRTVMPKAPILVLFRPKKKNLK